MPTFDLDLDIDDIISEMNSREKEQMYEELKKELRKEDSFVSSIRNIKLNTSSNPSFMEWEFLNSLLNIFNNRDRLTFEEEQYFINFSKKF